MKALVSKTLDLLPVDCCIFDIVSWRFNGRYVVYGSFGNESGDGLSPNKSSDF